MNLRHHKRGMLTYTNEGPNQNGGEFTITFGEAHFLDGYQTVFGELVEGESVLAAIESKVDRHGKVNDTFTIVAGGQKWLQNLYLYLTFQNEIEKIYFYS